MLATIADLSIGAFAKLGAIISHNRKLDRFAIRQYKGSFNKIKQCWDAIWPHQPQQKKQLAWKPLDISPALINQRGHFFGDFFIVNPQSHHQEYVIHNTKTQQSYCDVGLEVGYDYAVKKYEERGDRIIAELNDGTFQMLVLN